MKKYKLKKDLPLAKAGTEVFINEDIKINIAICMVNGQHIIAYIDEKDIDEWLEEIIEKSKSIFELEYGDEYYYIDYFSEIQKNKVKKEDFEIFEEDLNYGNVYLTKEEAEKELEKRQAIMRIKKYCWENGIKLADRDFLKNPENDRCEISYDVESKEISVSSYKFYNYMNIDLLFRSHHDAKNIVENCKNDLKIIFDV